ncbi:unnamed protein product [Spirodela intermedia]|uniref:Uncharacterized protein n=1 Tax=Spirodela intermedia TaxID=51605 RepID=A0A7I8INQ3_SPIIN|nr:unnamed protein product [Spirodela intermedia]CAA6659204.1 unnamed protein product [Spirodela intermedia]
MGTMFPENGGYVVWVSSALGPFWGFQQGWMKWLSGVIDNALYPIPAVAAGGAARSISVLALTAALTYLNYRGLTIVGGVAVFLGVFSILPFAVMGLLSIPRLEPSRWLAAPPDLRSGVDWNLYLNTLFWNLNYWDSISTLAGRCRNQADPPRALFFALILVVLAYFFPLLAGTGAVPLDRELWTDGYFSEAAAALSNMGMFVAEMSSDSFQLLGMAERGMLPEFFARRSPYGAPLVGILFSASGVALLSWLSFQEIIAAENFLYCFGMIMEFVAFVKLRVEQPAASRPYKVPLGTTGCVLMLLPPTVLIFMVVSLAAVFFGFLLHPFLKLAERRRWATFSSSSDLPALDGAPPREHDDIANDDEEALVMAH